jgi:beta-RFAP synthase
MPSSSLLPRLMHADTDNVVAVHAPGRLHLGFLDPAGSLGRRFGSVGLVIEGFATHVELSPARQDVVLSATSAASEEVERASGYLHALRQHTGRREPLQLRLLQVLPPHAGFGSGTQLALAVGRAFALWHGLDLSTATLARWLGRGLRSGIGIVGFDQGGLLVDGGPGVDGSAAPLLARLDMPESWRIVVVQDKRHRGLSGSEERQALAALAPLPQAAAADVCHQVLMRVLPGAASADFGLFAAGVTRMQQVLGAHFAPAQGGSAFASAAVGRLVRWLGTTLGTAAGEGSAGSGSITPPAAGIGQSSWGPTGFAILPSQAEADARIDAAQEAGLIDPALVVRIVSARNRGAAVT